MPDTVHLDGLDSYVLVKTYEDLCPANRSWFATVLKDIDDKDADGDEQTIHYLMQAATIGVANDELADSVGGLPLRDIISIFQTMCQTIDEENVAAPVADLDAGPPDP